MSITGISGALSPNNDLFHLKTSNLTKPLSTPYASKIYNNPNYKNIWSFIILPYLIISLKEFIYIKRLKYLRFIDYTDFVKRLHR